METQDKPIPASLMLFGRTPSVEDGRCVGRWAYAAAWLATDRPVARELARARLAQAIPAAMHAAMGAGRGDQERFNLVSAFARLPEALEGRGTLADALEEAVETMADRLLEDGAALRSATNKERLAHALRFDLKGFEAALREVGPDRNVLLREVAADLDESMAELRGPCPALRTLRLFLRATLAGDAQEASMTEGGVVGDEPLRTLSAWLVADVALLARRSAAYGAAWSAAARGGGDSLSRTVAGLASGAMLSNAVVESLTEDPWALVLAMAMTAHADHASALLDCGAQAQYALRGTAQARVAAWAGQAKKVGELETRLGIAVLTPYEVREGHADVPVSANLDLFAAWHAVRVADEARAALRTATERSIAAELARRREASRAAKTALETIKRRYDALMEAERGDPAPDSNVPLSTPQEDANAQRGFMLGVGAAAVVMGAYVAISLLPGNGGVVERIGPLVVWAAALPLGAAIAVQVAHALRRSGRAAEANRLRVARAERLDRARITVDREMGEALTQAKDEMAEADLRLNEFEALLRTHGGAVA